MAVGGQLLLQWETYLLHILWNLCGKPKRGRQEAFFFVLFFCSLGCAFIVSGRELRQKFSVRAS